jgi:S-formylglutathione hydrolase FrmB
MLEWSLLGGPVAEGLTGAGVVALLLLAFGTGRRWWLRLVTVVLSAAVLVVIATIAVERVWRPFPDTLPLIVLCLVWVALAGTGLAIARLPGGRNRSRSARVRRRVGAMTGALLVLVAAATQVNRYYGHYPTVRSALGIAPPNEVPFSAVPPSGGRLVTARPGQPLTDVWRPPPDMPATGSVTQVAIPGSISGFAARPGWLYLPPSYLSSPRALLPVLVLVAGQPGNPRDWLDGGRLSEVMDRFAATHHGIAPVVVIPDDLGRYLANPLCVDSRLGRVETYLTVDVPAWIRGHLEIDLDPRAFAIGGFSQGGTCALQLAVRAAPVYPTFIDISGQAEPSLGSRERTVATVFDGDLAAFHTINPLDLLATDRYPRSGGVIAAGRDDVVFRPQQHRVFTACRAAGMDVRWLELPGGHSWRVWGPALEQALPWLGARLGLTAP